MRDAFMTTSLYIDIMKISVSNIVYTGALDETTMSQLEFYEAAPWPVIAEFSIVRLTFRLELYMQH